MEEEIRVFDEIYFDVMYDDPVSIDELESQIEMLNESVKE